MQNEDLRNAWLCHECSSMFVFESDKEEHTKVSGHENFAVFEIESGKLLRNEGAK